MRLCRIRTLDRLGEPDRLSNREEYSTGLDYQGSFLRHERHRRGLLRRRLGVTVVCPVPACMHPIRNSAVKYSDIALHRMGMSVTASPFAPCGSTGVVVAPGGTQLTCNASATMSLGAHALSVRNPDGVYARKSGAVYVWGLRSPFIMRGLKANSSATSPRCPGHNSKSNSECSEHHTNSHNSAPPVLHA